MKKYLFLLLFVFCLPSYVWSATIVADSCSGADINTAIAASTAGDTISVPAGASCSWSTNVSINKANLKLVGAGIGSTVVTSGKLNINATGFAISGFTFTISGEAITVNTGGYYGVIFNNVFNLSSASTEIIKVYGKSDSWSTDHSMGGANNVFVEGNSFIGLGGPAQCTQGNYDARIVYRWNTSLGCKFDMHGLWSNGDPSHYDEYDYAGISSARHAEVYNNSFSQLGTFDILMEMRGGTGYIFNNIFTHITNSVGAISLREYCTTKNDGNGNCPSNCVCPEDYPFQDQIGRGKDQALEPMYFWNNLADGEQLIPWTGQSTDRPNQILTHGQPSAACVTYCGSEDGYTNGGSTWADMRDIIAADRDYYVSSTKPAALSAYAIYTCPHPSTDLTGSCLSNVAGVDGYNSGEADTTPPSIVTNSFSPSAQQACSPGPAANVAVTFTTNEAATCKWNLSDAAYDDMTGGTFTGGGTTAQSGTISGLTCSATTPIYIRCQDDEPTPNQATASSVHNIIVTSAVDEDAPMLSSVVLAADGRTLTITHSESVEFGLGGNGGVTITPSGGAATVAYVSGEYSTALVYTTSRVILSTETLTTSYTQPTAGIVDNATNELASYTDQATTNNSTQTGTPPVTGGGYTVFASDVDTPLETTNSSAIELGMKFTVSVYGYVTAVRFYKHALNTGTHTGNLWNALTRENLGTVEFVDETESGWQQQNFVSPIKVNPGTTYVISYHTASQDFARNANYFTSSVINRNVTALATDMAGGNGVYANSETSTYPLNASATATNFWVDLVFDERSSATIGGGSHTLTIGGGSSSLTW